MNHNFSSGAKKDLLVIFFAHSLINTGLDVQTGDGAIERDKDNKNHKENNRIDRRLHKLLMVMDETVNAIPKPLMNVLGKWINKQLNSKMQKILQKLSHKEVQLETLAIYILFCNFENRDVLMNVYKKFTEPSLYFDNLDLLEKVGVSEDTSGDMFFLAHDVISQIKG